MAPRSDQVVVRIGAALTAVLPVLVHQRADDDQHGREVEQAGEPMAGVGEDQRHRGGGDPRGRGPPTRRCRARSTGPAPGGAAQQPASVVVTGKDCAVSSVNVTTMSRLPSAQPVASRKPFFFLTILLILASACVTVMSRTSWWRSSSGTVTDRPASAPLVKYRMSIASLSATGQSASLETTSSVACPLPPA